ncbi:pyridoxamine 5'-phosphate oxidase family protein [Bradyrhizobium sp. WSM 1704]|uniref:pyridoxamine 5'-phosphate oxidase family protein n=1 Tax=Bradyrhizobium semiaridum TaxID=2821404 RepID=UPI0035DA90F2|nr:pyridoxamine 5'-phosphate oxidase family protein [Bradyrhizobium semiaridum]
MDPSYFIRDEAGLVALYGHGSPASLVKEVDHVHPHYRAFIEASSYVILATSGAGGLDASPRGDPAGFVVVEDEHTLLIPDRRGNNRVDTLHNLVADPRIALLFLVPGIAESLRVNGKATISIEPTLLARFAMGDKPPRSVVIVDVETVYFQCPRAAVRADLWNPDRFLQRSALPSNGTILADLSKDQGYRERDHTREETVRATLY